MFLTYLAISRLVCTAIITAFLETLNVKAIPRVVTGILAILFSVSIIVDVLNLVLHAVGGRLRQSAGIWHH